MNSWQAQTVYLCVRCGGRFRVIALGLLTGALFAAPAAGLANTPDRRAEERVAFHLARAEALRDALAPLVYGPCQRFPTRTAWDSYLATHVDQGVTFSAHLDEAWLVAKTAGDPELKARVKAARRRMLFGNPIQLIGKLVSCAWQNDSPLDAWGLWRRASAQATRRRQEVAREADLAIGHPSRVLKNTLLAQAVQKGPDARRRGSEE